MADYFDATCQAHPFLRCAEEGAARRTRESPLTRRTKCVPLELEWSLLSNGRIDAYFYSRPFARPAPTALFRGGAYDGDALRAIRPEL
jgi:hypothetical protein